MQRHRSRSIYAVEVSSAAYAGIHGCLGPFAYASIGIGNYISGGVVVIVPPFYWSEILTTYPSVFKICTRYVLIHVNVNQLAAQLTLGVLLVILISERCLLLSSSE